MSSDVPVSSSQPDLLDESVLSELMLSEPIGADLPPIEQPDTSQVQLKSEDGNLVIYLPPDQRPSKDEPGDDQPFIDLSWSDIRHQLKQRLSAGDRFWQSNTTVHLVVGDRLLDPQQLQEISDALSEVNLRIQRVLTHRRQTAVTAASAGYSVEQQVKLAPLVPSNEESPLLADPLYLETTLRSGADIQHNGSVIIVGDVNPGSSVVAGGDVLIWGRLRGIVHAGVQGNARCLIMALQMEPTQIRIADFVARPPETDPDHQFYPEVAYVTPQGTIRIASALDFYKGAGASRI